LLREAAVHVLGRRGDGSQREAVRKRLADGSPRVRLRAAEALVAARDREAVPTLVELLAVETVSGQAEEILYRIAGEKAPSAIEREEKGRGKWVEAWRTWWKTNGASIDLAKLDDEDRLLGFTLGIEYNTGRVWECGRDGKTRWEIRGLSGPMEAQMLPGNRLLVVESNNNTVSERDTSGKVLWQKSLGPDSPTGCRRLPNGNTFISTHGAVMEFNPKWERQYRFNLPSGSNAIWKARNGRILFTTNTHLIELDTAGKEVGRVALPGAPGRGECVGLRDLPGDRFLLACRGAALEVDRTGKVCWEVKHPGACGVCRLPSGNTLVSSNNLVTEFDRGGRKVWEVRSEGYVRRVHRR
jgi:hypothetical protein